MIYILLPAYNEEDSLDYLLPKLKKFFEEFEKRPFQIILCNDGSSDNTLAKAKKYEDKMPLKIINHKINRGLGETIRDLFELAAEISGSDDIFIRLDCDDTHDPAFIGGMIEKINEGYDVVIGSRFVKGGGQEGLSNYRKFISRMANYFMKIFFPIKNLKEYSSGFRAYRASTIKKAIDFYGNSFIQLKGLGFAGTLEKIVKLKIMKAKFAEAPMILRYDQKKSSSKMIGSITTFGYMTMLVMYYWPWGGWKRNYRKKLKEYEQNNSRS